MAFRSQRKRPGSSLASQMRAAIPLFVFGFLAMSLLRTLGDWGEQPFGFMSTSTWKGIIDLATQTATICLSLAMAAVGLGTSFSRLRGLGLRPLAVGLAAAMLVGLVSYVMVRTVGAYGLA
jgi:uncharacterized membrane protein YadS